MTEADREFFDTVRVDMPETVATIALYKLCDFLYRYYRKKVIILLDEYDTPMQEAWICGLWEELTAFCRSMFNAAFKTNPWLEQEKEAVKWWYDGFTFGTHKDIYNPWSILNFLDTGKYAPYWANTSSNSLVGKLIQEGNTQLKESSLSDTVQSALAQIEEKQYDAMLLQRGIPKERIHCYGFAFQGRNVLIGTNEN